MAMGAAVRAAAADGVVTFLWVLCVSTLGASTAAVTTYLSLHEGIHYALLVTVSILTLLLFAFNLLCDALGGASFNPTGVAAFYTAGLTNPSLFSIALRLPAQAAGASSPPCSTSSGRRGWLQLRPALLLLVPPSRMASTDALASDGSNCMGGGLCCGTVVEREEMRILAEGEEADDQHPAQLQGYVLEPDHDGALQKKQKTVCCLQTKGRDHSANTMMILKVAINGRPFIGSKNI